MPHENLIGEWCGAGEAWSATSSGQRPLFEAVGALAACARARVLPAHIGAW